MKIENPSRKRSHKLDGIGVGKIDQNVSISSDSIYDSVAYDPVKTRLSESEAEEPANRKARSGTLPLVYSSASAQCDSDSAVFT